MNTQSKMVITALFFTGSVSTALAVTLTPLEIYGTPDTPASTPLGNGSASSSFYYGIYNLTDGPLFHGQAHAEAHTSAESDQLFVGEREESSVKQDWEVKLILGGGSSTYSNIWVKYPVDDKNMNGTLFKGSVNNSGETTDHFSAMLSFGYGKEGLEPLQIINENEFRHVDTFLGGTKSIGSNGELYTYRDSSKYYSINAFGAFPGGTIFDIKGSLLAGADSHAWGAGGSLKGTASGDTIADLTFEIFATPVPEPETWTMMLVGGLLVAWQTRRRGQHLPADVPLMGYLPS